MDLVSKRTLKACVGNIVDFTALWIHNTMESIIRRSPSDPHIYKAKSRTEGQYDKIAG